nr:hypothetical protein GCM10017745_38020 [Saccharothrix mutabilis subsp. capreolus]
MFVFGTLVSVLSIDDRDSTAIEDPRIIEVAVPACAEMAQAVRNTVVPTDPAGRAAAIRAQNAHVERIPAKIRTPAPAC